MKFELKTATERSRKRRALEGLAPDVVDGICRISDDFEELELRGHRAQRYARLFCFKASRFRGVPFSMGLA